jgi:SAM-dependent methyltransferase
VSDDPRRTRWQQRYLDAEQLGQPCELLRACEHLLPTSGRALDLACGMAGNAALLAARGLESHAWDYADSAIEHIAALAARDGLTIHAAARDVIAVPPQPASFDVIVVSRFLERELCPAIADALRPGGLLFYQTFTRDKLGDAGPSQAEFLLAPNELLHLFAGLRVVHYREDSRFGDLDRGQRSEAWLVAAREAT